LVSRSEWRFGDAGDEIAQEHERAIDMEFDVLNDSLYILRRFLTEPLVNHPRLDEPAARPKIALLALATQLVLATFEAGLRGRFGAAANNVRSTGEVPALLLHMHMWPQRAEGVFEGSIKQTDSFGVVKAVSEQIEQDQPGMGQLWKRNNDKWNREVQKFSHNDPASMIAALGQKNGTIAIGPMGVLDPERFRALVVVLLSKTLEILDACRTSMASLMPATTSWETELDHVVTDGASLVIRRQDEILGPLASSGSN
jgi:hypothetical protein